MTSKLEIDSLTIRNSGNIFSSTLDGNVGDFVWSGSYLYICVAENSWKRVAVASWSAPDQVTGLTADDVGDTTIDLSWNAPSSDDPITDYIIEYTTEQNTLTVFVGSNTTSYQLTNLVTDSEYSIRVAAISSAGTGTYSVTITETPGLFDPTSITGLQAWYDASDASTLYDATTGGSLVAADGGVARWEDKSGNDYHMTQATAGARPLRKASVQNGLDGLRFDGSDDVMTVSGSASSLKALHAEDATFFVVLKAGTTSNPDALYNILDTNAGSSSNVGFRLAYDDRVAVPTNNRINLFVTNGTGNVSDNSANDLFAPNVYGLVSVVSRPTDGTAANRSSIRKNGGTAVENNTDTSSVSTADSTYDLHLGGRGTNSAYLTGDICEIIIYNSALSDTDREAVENYLIAKWGIT